MSDKISDKALAVFREKIAYCKEYGCALTGYRLRRIQSLMKATYGSGKYCTKNNEVFIINDFRLAKWEFLFAFSEKSKPLADEIMKGLGTCRATSEETRGLRRAEYESNGHTNYEGKKWKSQIDSAPSQGLSFDKLREHEWRIENSVGPLTGAQKHDTGKKK